MFPKNMHQELPFCKIVDVTNTWFARTDVPSAWSPRASAPHFVHHRLDVQGANFI